MSDEKRSAIASESSHIDSTPADAIERYRAAFESRGEFIHLNNAGIAPISRPAYEDSLFWLKRYRDEGSHCMPDHLTQVENTRRALAEFLNSPVHSTAFFANASSALSQVAFGYPLKEGDEIVIWDQEYPSNWYPWKEAASRSGAKLVLAKSGDQLETPLEALVSCLNERTKIVALSWVQFQSGAMTDLKALTRETRARGIFTVADIIQGAGLLPFDFADSGLDAACGGSHKWLTSPMSTGYLCLREEHIETLEPIAVGAITYGTPDTPTDLSLKPKASPQRFEPGSKNMIDITALGASLRLIEQTGMDRITKEVESLARRLLLGLREKGYEIHSPHGSRHRGAIVNFGPGPSTRLRSLEEISDVLKSNRVSFARRWRGIRLSPHAFNTQSEIEQILTLL